MHASHVSTETNKVPIVFEPQRCNLVRVKEMPADSLQRVPQDFLGNRMTTPTLAALAPAIYQLSIERFRGMNQLSWRPARGANVILGGGDVGKTTILDAVGLLLSPTNSVSLSDTDYYDRDVKAGFVIEGIVSLPPASGIDHQTKASWPWLWNGDQAVVPSMEGENATQGEAVYRFRVRGTDELDLVFEIIQPDNTVDTLPVTLRRAIGLVRLSGDERNDRDLRLVQGSALDRLLSDKTLRARLSAELAKKDIRSELSDTAKQVLVDLDLAVSRRRTARWIRPCAHREPGTVHRGAHWPDGPTARYPVTFGELGRGNAATRGSGNCRAEPGRVPDNHCR